MKKVFVSLLIFLILPFIVKAEYKVTDYYVDAVLLDNGDMSVEELIVLKGSFNNFEKNLLYQVMNDKLYDASAITDVSVMGKEINGDVSFETFKSRFNLFNKVDIATDGSRQKYIETTIENGINLNIFYRTNNSKTAFLIKYKIKNVGINHADVIEFYWNFLDNINLQELNNVNLCLRLPKMMAKDDFNWWFHGNLAEESSIKENNDYINVFSHANHLKKGEAIEFRFIAQKDYFASEKFLKMDNDEVSAKIISKENEKEASNLKIINKNKLIDNIIKYITLVFLICLIITWIIFFIKFDQRRKVKYLRKYNRKIIDNYNVEDVEYLMNKKVSIQGFLASFLNLIYKKNIKYEKYVSKKNESIRFILINKEKINEAEDKLIDILFYNIGTKGILTIDDLKKYFKNKVHKEKFNNSFMEWQKIVEQDTLKQKFFSNNKKIKIISIIFLIISIIIIVISLILKSKFLLSKIIIIPALLFFLYALCINKKSEKGLNHYLRWKAFKHFLEDFGAFASKDLPEISTWDQYLVYAWVFDLYEQVKAAMNEQIKEMPFSKAKLNKYLNNLDKDFLLDIKNILINYNK